MYILKTIYIYIVYIIYIHIYIYIVYMMMIIIILPIIIVIIIKIYCVYIYIFIFMILNLYWINSTHVYDTYSQWFLMADLLNMIERLQIFLDFHFLNISSQGSSRSGRSERIWWWTGGLPAHDWQAQTQDVGTWTRSKHGLSTSFDTFETYIHMYILDYIIIYIYISTSTYNY